MAQDNLEEIPWRRWWLKPLIVLVLAVALGFGGWRLYLRWQLDRLVTEARALTERGEYRPAVLALERALQINPASAKATRAMAELTDKLGLETAVDWRRSVLELDPGSASDALALASSALRHRNTTAAQQALEKVSPAEREQPQFHTMAGGAAIAAGHYAEAEKHFSEALRLQPDNLVAQYNLAVIQVQSPDEAKRRDGQAALARLAQSGRFDLLARRALVTRLAREKKLDEAQRWSAELVALPQAEFRDRLTHLDLLRASQSPQLPDAIAQAEAAASKAAPEDAAAMLTWLRGAGQVQDALSWAATLAAPLADHPRVAVARAECLRAAGQWKELQALMEKGSWAEWEFARHAYRARAARELNDTFSSGTFWSAAITAAKTRDQLSQLAWLAARWKWTPQLQETLWTATRQPKPEWALQMLHRVYRDSGDTEGLLRVARAALARDEKDLNALNNVAMLLLLLGRDPDEAMKMARQVHTAAPANATFASTYAFALHRAGRTAEGLGILRKLPAEQLKKPEIAAYFAVLLTATGEKAEAEPFRVLAREAALLPEEKALLAAGGP
jgi:tetratricopeptide (TPR) repeat protein